MRRLSIAPLVLLMFLIGAGCGNGRSITGKVVYKGSSDPVPNVIVLFEGIDPDRGSHQGVTDALGNFKLKSVTVPEVQPGEYRVGFGTVVADDHHEVDVGDPNAAEQYLKARNEFVRAEQLKILPERFLDAQTSGVVCTVTPDQSHYVLEVDRPSR
jgi:hypothetical protein